MRIAEIYRVMQWQWLRQYADLEYPRRPQYCRRIELDLSLRVIAGKARGMKLKAVPGASTRPIMDRAKEALFSIIGSDIRGANFLDLFAGTGSVGIEALSRGAEFALFVELNWLARQSC